MKKKEGLYGVWPLYITTIMGFLVLKLNQYITYPSINRVQIRKEIKFTSTLSVTRFYIEKHIKTLEMWLETINECSYLEYAKYKYDK